MRTTAAMMMITGKVRNPANIARPDRNHRPRPTAAAATIDHHALTLPVAAAHPRASPARIKATGNATAIATPKVMVELNATHNNPTPTTNTAPAARIPTTVLPVLPFAHLNIPMTAIIVPITIATGRPNTIHASPPAMSARIRTSNAPFNPLSPSSPAMMMRKPLSSSPSTMVLSINSYNGLFTSASTATRAMNTNTIIPMMPPMNSNVEPNCMNIIFSISACSADNSVELVKSVIIATTVVRLLSIAPFCSTFSSSASVLPSNLIFDCARPAANRLTWSICLMIGVPSNAFLHLRVARSTKPRRVAIISIVRTVSMSTPLSPLATISPPQLSCGKGWPCPLPEAMLDWLFISVVASSMWSFSIWLWADAQTNDISKSSMLIACTSGMLIL